jgi:tetratricopeptide (TPR) repeat protein
LCQPFRSGAAPGPAPTFTTHDLSGLTQPFFGRLLDNAVRNSAGQPKDAIEALISARLREARGDRDRALTILTDLVAAHPAYVPGLEQRGQTLDAAGQRDAAVEAYRAVLAVAPDSVVSLNNLAYLLAEAPDGVHPEALTHARRAYEVSKGQGVIADTYGWVLFLTGESGQAERVLRDAVARQPAMAELRLHLARVLLAQGQLPAAKEQWDQAVTLDAGVREHKHAGPLVETFSAQQPGR